MAMSDHLYEKFLWEAGVPGHEPPVGRTELDACPVCEAYAVTPDGRCLACERDADPEAMKEA